ncbi:MAG: TIGR00289 family protein, partial [Thaumarchaeota archaeon]
LDAPIFRHRIEIIEAEVDWRGDRGFLRIKGAKLAEKENY